MKKCGDSIWILKQCLPERSGEIESTLEEEMLRSAKKRMEGKRLCRVRAAQSLACSFLPATSLKASAHLSSFIFFPSIKIEGNIWRAVFVALLAFIAFALARYWQNLEGRSSNVRWSLVSLRGAALLLLAVALVGVSVEYDSAARARILVGRAHAQSGNDDAAGASSTTEDAAVARAVATLREKNLEGVEAAEEFDVGHASENSFAAAVLFLSRALRADEARREVERMNAAAGGAPVYIVADFEKMEGPRVAIESVEVVGAALRGVPLAVRCSVHARGMSGRESLLTISDEAKVQSSARIRWTADDERQTVMLEVVPKAAGWMNYSARMEGAESSGAQMLSRPFMLYVEERRLRVLFFEGEPTWEAKFIRRALEQTGLFEVDYFAQVSRTAAVGAGESVPQEKDEEDESAQQQQPTQNAKPDEKSAAKNTPEAKLHEALSSAARLNAYECVIVGATPNEMLSTVEIARVREWVKRRGGGLIVLGGNSFPGSIAAPNGRLYAMLPAEVDQRGLISETAQTPGNKPVEVDESREGEPLTPTMSGAAGPLRGYLKASEDRTAQKMSPLTGLGFKLSALRAGALAFAVNSRAGEEGTNDAGQPLIAGMRDGAGRTLLFAPADSWRIQTSASTTAQDEAGGPFAALWQGLALWSAAGARDAAEIVLSNETPAAGNELTAELRVRDPAFAPLKIERINARLQPLAEGAGEQSATAATQTAPREIAFAPDETDQSVWRARFVAPPVGRYSIEADFTAGGKNGSLEKRFAATETNEIENAATQDTLRRIARETGGDSISISELKTLVAQLKSAPRAPANLHRTWELRSSWLLALIIPLILSTEWFLRRFWHVD